MLGAPAYLSEYVDEDRVYWVVIVPHGTAPSVIEYWGPLSEAATRRHTVDRMLATFAWRDRSE